MTYAERITKELVNGQKNSLLRMFTESLKTDPLTKCRSILEYMEKTPDLSLSTVREGLDTVSSLLYEAQTTINMDPIEHLMVVSRMKRVSIRLNQSVIG